MAVVCYSTLFAFGAQMAGAVAFGAISFNSNGLALVQTRATVEERKHLEIQVSDSDIAKTSGDHVYPVRGRVNVSTGAEHTWPVQVSSTMTLQRYSSMLMERGSTSSLVILFQWSESQWDAMQDESYECVFESGQTSSVRKHAHEKKVAYPAAIQWACELPKAMAPQECQKVRLQAAGASESLEQSTVKVCNDANGDFSGENYYLSACAPIPYEDPEHLSKSGFKQLPQWLEYHTMHGVEHFLFYILVDLPKHRDRMMQIVQPYLDAGLGSVVEVAGVGNPGVAWERDHALIANDCLYRMKFRTHWLMPTVDSDEYVHVEGKSSIAEGLRSIEDHAATPLNSVHFPRYQFMVPESDGALHISEQRRQNRFAPLCPKYILQPAHTYTLFIHWPISTTKQSKAVATEGLIWAAHYRLDEARVERDGIELVEDQTLVAEVDSLKQKMAERYRTDTVEGLILDGSGSAAHQYLLNLQDASAHQLGIFADAAKWMAQVNEKLAAENRSVCLASPVVAGVGHWTCDQGISFQVEVEA